MSDQTHAAPSSDASADQRSCRAPAACPCGDDCRCGDACNCAEGQPC